MTAIPRCSPPHRLCDPLDTGRIGARHPRNPGGGGRLPDPQILEQVLVGLRNL
jgi:hypothetical protein